MSKLPLNLLYLKYFYDAVRSGSISQSARFNHVSQSAVSQGIIKLEVGLNTTLISHQPNRFRLTEDGKKLFESSKKIFRAITQSEEELSQNKEVTLTFACTHSFALCCLSPYIQKAKVHLPHIRFNIRLGQYFAIKEMIRKGVVDFGILVDNDDLTSFDCYKIMQGQYRLWVSKEIKNERALHFLLDNEERKETNLLKANYKSLFKKELPVLMEVSSWAVCMQLVQKGLGVGLAPDYVAHDTHAIKPVFSKLNPGSYTLYAVFEKNNTPSCHAQAFLNLFS
jgi:DNA-binding transcriptional LysR family regulator